MSSYFSGDQYPPPVNAASCAPKRWCLQRRRIEAKQKETPIPRYIAYPVHTAHAPTTTSRAKLLRAVRSRFACAQPVAALRTAMTSLMGKFRKRHQMPETSGHTSINHWREQALTALRPLVAPPESPNSARRAVSDRLVPLSM